MTELVPIAPTVSEGLILPPSPPVTDQSGRVFIVFVDDMHIQHKDTIQTRKIMEKIRDTPIHEGDLIGIVSTGHSSLEVDLTHDVKKKRFNEAINRVSGSALSPQEIIDASQTADGRLVSGTTRSSPSRPLRHAGAGGKAEPPQGLHLSERGLQLQSVYAFASRTCRKCTRAAFRSLIRPSPARRGRQPDVYR